MSEEAKKAAQEAAAKQAAENAKAQQAAKAKQEAIDALVYSQSLIAFNKHEKKKDENSSS